MSQKTTHTPPEQVDYLVIGSGIAGLSFALDVASSGSVLLLTKSSLDNTATRRAQGGIASVLARDDTFEQHERDTLRAGSDLCHMDAVRLIVEEGPGSIDWLVEHGTRFTRLPGGFFDLGREGGHTRNRIVHFDDLTGAEIERALLDRVRNHPNIQTLEHWLAVDLITSHHLPQEHRQDGGPCFGVYAMSRNGAQESGVRRILARITVLATGGAGQVYLHTSNPDVATGDGVALVYRAGGELANLEFFQFHPTTLYHPEANNKLITEALRGHGARLVTRSGKSVMEGLHPMGELAPRDIVARGIDAYLKRSGEECVYLDATGLDSTELLQRFPNIARTCAELGIDICKQRIPVVPAAHYMCGGVHSDLEGRTSLKGLYAVGEVAWTGVHGANRLASNSLLEAVVFARRAAASAKRELAERQVPVDLLPLWDMGTTDFDDWVLIEHDRIEIRRLMWDYVGIVRSGTRLRRARSRMLLIAREIEDFYRRALLRAELVELRNLVAVANLIIKSALFREESRGLHYRTDFPERDDENWFRDTIIRRSRPEAAQIDNPGVSQD